VWFPSADVLTLKVTVGSVSAVVSSEPILLVRFSCDKMSEQREFGNSIYSDACFVRGFGT
jgi:hypothetical protein